jgi:hypothetical protein
MWEEQRPVRCYGALNDCLPWQLQQRFKIKHLNVDGAFTEYWLALELTTISENSRNLDPLLNLVQVLRQKCKSTIDCATRTRAHAQLIASFPWTPARRAAYSHL